LNLDYGHITSLRKHYKLSEHLFISAGDIVNKQRSSLPPEIINILGSFKRQDETFDDCSVVRAVN